MTKRFTTDNGSNEDVCLVDNLTKKEYESNFNDIVDVMNNLWGQTQRFEKHNKYLMEENEQLKKCIKEIDDAELHLKQIILKRIDDYIWEWEDEGTPVAQVLKELQNEINGGDVE